MFKYNETSQVYSFIQSLLRSKNVPMLPILRDPEGLFNNKGIPEYFSYIHDGYFYLGKNRKAPYIFGEKYANITNNYIPTESYYSSEMHEYLGEYLRAYRDTYKIDLMGLYNCFSNRLISKVALPISVREVEEKEGKKKKSFATWYKFNSPNDNYKVTCFPIKYNMEYKIKIYGSTNTNILLQPIFYSNGDYLEMPYNSYPLIFDLTTQIYDNDFSYTLNLSDTVKKFLFNISKNNNEETTLETFEPKEKDVKELAKYLLENEKYLYLFVQTSQTSDLRMSVIEEAEYFQILNNTLLSLDNIDYNVPFSDRLLEFLTENVITPHDEIKQNITRIQAIIMSGDFKKAYYKELFNSPLYYVENKENITKETEKQEAVLAGHYLRLKRFKEIKETDKEALANSFGNPLEIPPFNIIEVSEETYYPVPGVYDDTMRVLLYDLFANYEVTEGQPIKDFTGYVDKDIEELLLKCVASDSLKARLLEI